VPYEDTEDTIKKLIGDITLEMSAEDYNPLPDLIVNDIEIDGTNVYLVGATGTGNRGDSRCLRSIDKNATVIICRVCYIRFGKQLIENIIPCHRASNRRTVTHDTGDISTGIDK
jgi:hypothetical protein